MQIRQVDAAHFAADVRDFLGCLVEQGVEFLIVGGEAVILHGYPRVTGDLDVFYRRSVENVTRLFAALKAFWGGRVPGVRSASSLAEDGVIVQFGVPPHRIDLVNRIDGVSFDEAWEGRVRVRLVGLSRRITLHYIGVEALIANKRAIGRHKDLEDLRYLTGRTGRRRGPGRRPEC